MEQNTKLTMLFQFSILLLALATVTSEAISFGPKFHVHIVNGFKTDVLYSHCKSKDDDLGIRQTSPGQEYEWSFHLNIWGTTLYFCSFWWVGGHHQNDVFWNKHGFIYDFCGVKNCIWKLQEDGIYLFKSLTGTFELMYEWDK
ncbi:hypothetical protein HS088_TW18G00102 [Tripterygium wilfordii]|uniref:S-protein homolog n=1 Tax=Tripterygium wilfordii TaxID=458696 RepID=A0A7J7CBX0_TRIWF|nr:S-protein homolog 2-like [Tripterygium wilfordii]KAF5731425.1 hypothetical protein HS088_TW18G00102 [Tripterygium wilfordii]